MDILQIYLTISGILAPVVAWSWARKNKLANLYLKVADAVADKKVTEEEVFAMFPIVDGLKTDDQNK